MAFRFIHTADIHLDSPLRSLAMRDPEIAEMIGNATRQAFMATVQHCLDEQVDALMIAGDLYDGDLRSMKTAVFFGIQMRRLTEAGIRVFVIRGNHDAESVITKHLSLPDGVHLFTGRAEIIRIEDKDVAVHGISFAQPHAPESLLPKFKPPLPDCTNIGLLHTSLAGTQGHDTYSPCSLADLTAHGFDYWGLGHIHKRQVHAETPCAVVMPGIPQGRDIGEAGPKSVTLATIGDDSSITLEECSTSIVQFERVTVDVSDLAAWSDVLVALEAALGTTRDATRSESLVARLEITGATPIASLLRRDADVLLEEARQIAGSLRQTAIETVSMGLSAPSAAIGAPGNDPIAELRLLISDEVLPSEAFLTKAAEILGDLQHQLPPELRDGFGESDHAIRQTVKRFIEEGSEDVLVRLENTARAEP